MFRFALLFALVAIASAVGDSLGGNLRVLASPGVQSAIDVPVVAILFIYIVLSLGLLRLHRTRDLLLQVAPLDTDRRWTRSSPEPG